MQIVKFCLSHDLDNNHLNNNDLGNNNHNKGPKYCCQLI